MLDTDQLERMGLEMACALSPATFARLKLDFEPDPWQEQVLESDSRGLLLNCARQCGKSTTMAIKGLHRVVYHPRSMVLLSSASMRQAQEIFLKLREFLAQLGQGAPALDQDNALSLRLDNGSRVVSVPSEADTVRGYSSVDMLIEDEARYVDDDFYSATRPMLIVSKGQHILASTPAGKQGHFYKLWADGGPEWERVLAPATLCPRIPPEELERERRNLSPAIFQQEYMCEFVEKLEAMFREEDIERLADPTLRPLFPHRLRRTAR